MKKDIVTIEDIRNSIYDAVIDSEYREAMDNTLMALNYVKDSPSYLYYGTSKQKLEILKVETKPLNSNQISEIIHLMMYQMRDDFTYGRFKPVAMKYIEISEKMRDKSKVNNQEYKKPKCDLKIAYGNMIEMLGLASNVLKENNMHNESREMIEKATLSYGYDDAYKVIEDYVEVVKEAVKEDEEEFE